VELGPWLEMVWVLRWEVELVDQTVGVLEMELDN
jgi:hypothetical protein